MSMNDDFDPEINVVIHMIKHKRDFTLYITGDHHPRRSRPFYNTCCMFSILYDNVQAFKYFGIGSSYVYNIFVAIITGSFSVFNYIYERKNIDRLIGDSIESPIMSYFNRNTLFDKFDSIPVHTLIPTYSNDIMPYRSTHGNHRGFYSKIMAERINNCNNIDMMERLMPFFKAYSGNYIWTQLYPYLYNKFRDLIAQRNRYIDHIVTNLIGDNSGNVSAYIMRYTETPFSQRPRLMNDIIQHTKRKQSATFIRRAMELANLPRSGFTL